ncbi:MAG: hypothetical protein HY033_07805 [Ignavibacteriae bacterium]|nr:hypothetical protein [Ignavibacteria bacterium]MBI3364796.1 hypothetical protein [Ignavibacteriota bacterium]
MKTAFFLTAPAMFLNATPVVVSALLVFLRAQAVFLNAPLIFLDTLLGATPSQAIMRQYVTEAAHCTGWCSKCATQCNACDGRAGR